MKFFQRKRLMQAIKITNPDLDYIRQLLEQSDHNWTRELTRVDCFGWSPLLRASFYGHEEVVHLFLVKCKEETGQNNVLIKSTVCRPIDQQGIFGASALILASQNGHLKVVELLIFKGRADLELTADNGATALWMASQNAHHKVVKKLIKCGADVNRSLRNGATPLYVACQEGHKDVVDILLKEGADTSLGLKTRRGGTTTPLAIAIETRNFAIARAISNPHERSFRRQKSI